MFGIYRRGIDDFPINEQPALPLDIRKNTPKYRQIFIENHQPKLVSSRDFRK